MATLGVIISSVNCTSLIMAIICFLFLLRFARRKGHPWNWPLIGMLPFFLPIFRSVFDSLTDVLECTKGTFIFKGPWFGNRNMIITCDPANFYHIMSSNFSNYPKGPDTKLLFEAYGEFLFSADHDEWRKHRAIAHGFLSDRRMHLFTPKANLEILKNGLIPVFDNASEQGLVLDLQDVFKRFMLDATCMIATGYNHGSLQIGLPEDSVLKAFHDINQEILMRHILPESSWKLQSWLGVGKEKKLQEASETLDSIAAKYLERRRKDLCLCKDNQEEFHAINIFPLEVIMDVIKGLLFAGTDTASSALTSFFWQVLENPVVECKIRKEIEANLSPTKAKRFLFIHPEELNNLVYLHAALLESLRLYPPVPFQSRTCIQPNILPSGHHVCSMMKVALSSYAMGRMKSIWGEDCLQFKPERWISEKGKIILVPSNKFVAFSCGPRICPGKELALIRLKTAAATIIHNYDIEIIKNHPVIPTESIILDMKYGLKARITKRSTTQKIVQ